MAKVLTESSVEATNEVGVVEDEGPTDVACSDDEDVEEEEVVVVGGGVEVDKLVVVKSSVEAAGDEAGDEGFKEVASSNDGEVAVS